MYRLLKNFKPIGGKHCITTSLRQIFNYYEHPLSEEMLFGLGEGIDFTYINLSSSPMVSGRSKVMEFENALAKNLGIKIKVKKVKEYNKAFKVTKQMIDSGHPVLAYVDMPYMEYFGLNEDNHFGGHSIVIFGYDDEKTHFYVSDRDNNDYPIPTPKGQISKDFHTVSYTQMQTARSSNYRPFPANNKYLSFDFNGFTDIDKEKILSAIGSVCEKMLNPPAKLKGVLGISKFSKEINKWHKFDLDKIKRAGATNYFQISEDGGTGGGIFRRMYGRFLIEASGILINSDIKYIGEQFITLSKQWDDIAIKLWKLYETGDSSLFKDMSKNILIVSNTENLLFTQLQNSL